MANSFFLVYSPKGRPTATRPEAGNPGAQIGSYRADGSIDTASHPGANAVNLLVQTGVLNYMALHNQTGQFPAAFQDVGQGLGADLDKWVAFAPICNGTINS